MIFTDTHTHLYLKQFDNDRIQVIVDAINEGVKYMLLPNIDSSTITSMMDVCKSFPENCFPMIGVHPTSAKQNYKEELAIVEKQLTLNKFIAIGEIGIDLYWDKTHLREQQDALRRQIQMAKDFKLPIVLHVRDSFDEVFEIIDEYSDEDLKGVFHCFTGTLEQAERIINWGFKFGIGGVLTYKNSGLDQVVKDISIDHLILETDAPFLTPKPFRGKRNESAYIKYIAQRLSEIKNLPLEKIAEITTNNAMELFNFPRN